MLGSSQGDWNLLLTSSPLMSRSPFSQSRDFLMDQDWVSTCWCPSINHRHGGRPSWFLSALRWAGCLPLSLAVFGAFTNADFENSGHVQVLLEILFWYGVPAYQHTGQGIEQLCIFFNQLKYQGGRSLLGIQKRGSDVCDKSFWEANLVPITISLYLSPPLST